MIDADCVQGKHHACPGYTYTEDMNGRITEVPCGCSCHVTTQAIPRPADRHER
jgi:hypothetical protein